MSDPRAPEADPAALWALRGALALMTVGIALHRFVEPDALSGWLYVDLEAADEGEQGVLWTSTTSCRK